MRSVIEEIATAERQAEDIRVSAAAQARELSLQAREDAQAALFVLENESREAMQAELEKAKLEGESLSAELQKQLQSEADALCAQAAARLDGAVAYLLNKVTKTA